MVSAPRESVVLPAPEGADRINIIPRRVRRSDDMLKISQAREDLQIRVLPGNPHILLNRSRKDGIGTSRQNGRRIRAAPNIAQVGGGDMSTSCGSAWLD